MDARNFIKAVACALTAIVLADCGFGLSPSWKDSSGTTVSLSLASLGETPSAQASRAVMPGVNYLYIRTVGIAGNTTGELYGPFTVTAGSRFVTNEIPPGDYERIAVLASAKDLEADSPSFAVYGGNFTFRELLSLPDSQFLEFVSDSVDKEPLDAWFEGMVCFGERFAVTIEKGRENALSVTLTPNIRESDRIDLSSGPYKTYSSAERSRRFYRLSGIQVSVPVTTGSLACTMTAATEASGAVHSVRFYSRDGVAVPVTRSGTSLVSGLTWTIAPANVASLAGTSGYIELYQYLDFEGTVTANYQNTGGGLSVAFDGQGNSALFGKRILLAAYGSGALAAAAAGQSWETFPVVGYAILSLDSVAGSGRVTIPVPLSAGAVYCVSAQIDMNGRYASLSNLDSVADIATIVPYQGDYLTNGTMGLISFVGTDGIALSLGDFSAYDDSVFFVSQSGGGSGASPGSPITLAAAITSINNTPAIAQAQIYVTEPLSIVNMFQINGKYVSIKSYTSATMSVGSISMLSINPFIDVIAGGSLALEKITLDCSTVTTPSVSLIRLASGTSTTLTMGYRSKLVGQKTQAFSGQGGGILVGSGCTLHMNGGTVDSCRANEGGAIYVMSGGVANLSEATITNNVHDVAGNGAIAVAGTVNARNVSFAGNTNNENYVLISAGQWIPF
jgi:hypothetical protein